MFSLASIFNSNKRVEVPAELHSVEELLKVRDAEDFLFEGERFLDPQIVVQAQKAHVVGLPALVLEDELVESDSEESLSLGNSEGSPEISASLIDVPEIVLTQVDPDCALDDEIMNVFAPAKLFVGTAPLEAKPFVHTAILIDFSQGVN